METVTPQLSKREKLKLIMELNDNLSKLESGDGSLAKREKLKVIMRTNTLLDLLGFNVESTEPEVIAPILKNIPPISTDDAEDPDKVENERKVTRGIRQKANNAAIELLKQIKSGEVGEVTDAMREVLKGYTGSGGNLTTADGLKGSIYEYYTPKPIAAGVWNLLGEMGFTGGKILDPSAGTGVFGQTAPKSALVDAIELDDISGSINQLINPNQNVKVSPFEAIAANTPEEMYDAVVTNVPFGSVQDRGGNAALDPRYKSKSLEYYFILRSLDKLKPNGLAAFIVPPRVIDGKDGMEMDLRYYSSLKAEFMGAYRLPNSVFGDAHADTITDVIVYKKHSKEVAEKIKELLREKPEVLTQANVLFDEFLTGKYFHGEGKRFVLGEFVAKDPNKYRDVNRVINNGKVSDIAKLLQKFPDSRIDWPMIDAAETMPIFYNEGDTIAQDGRILAFKNGEWVPVESSQDDIEMLNIGATLNTAINALTNQVTYEKADKYYMDAMRRADYGAIPYWLRRTVNAITKVGGDASTATNTYNGLMTAFALNEVLDHHAQSEPFNYLADYPELSDAIKINRKFANSTNTAIDVDMREMVSLFKVFYNQKKNEFSARWRGDVQTADDLRVDTSGLSEYQRYEKLKYGRSAHGSMNFIPLDVLKKELGEQFDPYTNDDWCISTDGKSAIHREDYFTGRYSDYLGFADLEIMNAENEQVKAKLMRQKAISAQFAPKLDVTKMTFGIRGPFVSNEDKLDFLRRYVDTRYELVMDLDGKEKFVFNGVSKHSDSDHAKYRLTFYMNGQTARTGTTAQTKEDDPVREARRKKLLDELVQVAESQFGVWVKSNSSLMTRLDAKANANENLHFANVYNGSPLKIDGIKDDFQGKLHDYQNSAVRQYSRNFGGILGFDVGLGKAQPLDAKVLTPTGWRLMGDIKVGDFVIAVDGTAVAVTGVYPQGQKEIFEVEFSDGAKTRCCDEHLWLTQTESDRKKERYAKKQGDDRVITGSVKSLSVIKDSLIYQTQKNHSIPIVAPIQFAEKLLPIDPYLMGVLLGDGCISHKTVTFCNPDAEILEKVKEVTQRDYADLINIKQLQDPRVPTFILSRATNEQNVISTALALDGLMGLKSPEKYIPDDYLHASIEQRVMLLRGLMDTDGYVSKDGITVQFYSSSKMLADGVLSLVQSLGGIGWIKSKIPTFTYKGQKRQGLLAYTVSIRMPSAINPFLLSRKANRVQSKSKYLPVRYFTNVVSVGMAEAQCISIDHPTHLYVTDDYIVTHNTFTALATIQYVQSIGVKNKTIITVPASVLSNWRREAMAMYTDASMEECLFVGLRLDPSKVDKNGVIGTTYDSGKVAEDLNRILENKHKKIFMTAESFAKIPMRQESLEEYVAFMQTADESFGMQSDKSRDAVKQESLAQNLLGDSGKDKAANVPYFEDMGVDSLVGDEFHVYKNSKQTVDFKGAKFLSKADASGRGIDAQIKCWYIRDRSPHGDGVLGLTATPITNSPLEIYSMLSLAVGEKRVSDGLLGARGADAFMMGVCDIQTKEELNIVGDLSNADVFVGLNNVGLIRGLLGQVANVKSAAEVNLKIPEKEVIAIPVDLELETIDQLKEFKTIYGIARRMVNPKANPQPTANEIAYVEEFSERYGEPAKLLANPFNLISKMTDLIVDHDLTYKFSKWDIDPAQAAIAETVVQAFNKLSIKEERTRLTILSTEDDIVKTKAKKKADPDGEDEPPLLIVMVKAIVKDNAILLDSVDFKTQSRLLALCEKRGLNLKVTFSPKIAAMIENFKKEESTPRMGSKAKQLIFCDNKGLHNKLKQALVQECGIPASQIIIINGITGKDAGDLQEMQDGFNSVPDEIEGTDYVFRVAICNKKAEVGINLQKGTQAIHHLTIGWTPDSIQQRDGRGVRQGNKIEKVNVYMYDANGTFDEYKRMLVGKKSNWIGDVLAKDGSDKVATNSEISSKDYEDLVNSIGDADATRKARERIEENAKKAAIMLAKSRQVQNVKIAAAQVAYLKKTGEYDYIKSIKVKFVSLMEKAKKLQAASTNEKVSEGFRQRNKAKLAEIQPQLDKLMAEIKNGMTGKGAGVDHSNPEEIWMSYNSAKAKSAQEWADTRTGSGVILAPESELYDAWQQDIAVANNMIDEAGKAFALESGGYPASVFAMYREGKAVLLSNGEFVCDKSWLSHANGDLYLLRTNSSGGFNVVRPYTHLRTYRDSGYMMDKPYKNDDLQELIADGKGVVTQYFDSNYSQLFVVAAKVDDLCMQAGNTSHTNYPAFFSEHIPEVAQFTTAKPTVWFSMFSYTLPSPNFPFIVDDYDEMLRVVPMIARQQQAIIKKNPNDKLMFTLLDDNVELIPFTGTPLDYRKTSMKTLIDYLEAEGIVVNADNATSAIGVQQRIIIEILQPVISEAVKNALERDAEKTFTNDAEGLNYAYDVAKIKLSYFETGNLHRDLEYINVNMFMLAMLTQDVLSMLKARNDIPTNPYLSKIDAVSANGLVGIGISAQYPNGLKDIYKTIKSVCSSVSNKKAYWYGKATVWTVTVEACKYLTEKYPDDMRKVTFVNPSVSRLSIG